MFDTGKIQGIEAILTHREQRANLQKKLLSKYPNETLLVFTLNIPGSIKNNSVIERLFHWGQVAIQEMFVKQNHSPIYTKEINLPSGLDWFVVVSMDPYSLKYELIKIEEQNLVGRLLDLDVLFLKENKMEVVSRQPLGFSERTCFICGKPGKICARNRAHTVSAMQEKIKQIIDEHSKGVENNG